jgi:hypothetical protein
MRTLLRQTLEEVSSIQTRGAFERIRRSLCHELLEEDCVDIDASEVQDDGVPVDSQTGRVDNGKRSAKGEQGLAQPTPRLALGQMAPEEGGERVTSVGPWAWHREVRQQGLRPAGSQAESVTRVKASLKTAEQGEGQAPHDPSACSSIA